MSQKEFVPAKNRNQVKQNANNSVVEIHKYCKFKNFLYKITFVLIFILIVIFLLTI